MSREPFISDHPAAELNKPLLRGHFHQAGFFLALGAGAMLVAQSTSDRARMGSAIYVLSLITLLGVSALYHRPHWSPGRRAFMRRLDHSAIFILIAGTATPIALFALPEESSKHLLIAVWLATFAGVVESVFWVHAPKWVIAALAVLVGWLVVPYFGEIKAKLGSADAALILVGGVVYTMGALVYAFKRPNPFPKTFGYHEIFHLLVLLAALFHFTVIAGLIH